MEKHNFNLYFAGSGISEAITLKRQLGCNQLLSQLNERRELMDWVEYLRANPECKSKLFVDSGAYSAYTKGKVIDVDDYIDLINRIGDVVTVFAQVDKIPQQIGREPTPAEFSAAAECSWNNYLYMIERIKPEYRDKLMPVFHFQEDTKWLTNMLEYTHEDGSHIKYIGLAVSTIDNADIRSRWLDMCFKIIKKSSNPDVMTHAFGLTAWDVLTQFPLTSSDSTTWVLAAVNGNILVKKKMMNISDRRIGRNDHLFSKPQIIIDAAKAQAEKYGFTLEQLSTDPYARQLYNIHAIKEWSDTYECEYRGKGKVQLF